MRLRKMASAVLRTTLILAVMSLATVISASVSVAAGETPLADRVARTGTVRVLARLPVATAQLALPGTVAGDRTRRVAIRSARARVEQDLGDTAWQVVHSYDSIPYLALEVGADALDRLQRSDGVVEIFEDRLEKILLGESAPLVQADQAFAEGYDGAGWAVAVVDTGIEGEHNFLEGTVVREACFSANGSCPNGKSEQIGAGAAVPCDFAESACLHGTHVAGVVAGDGQNVDGIARGADLIAIQVFSKFTGEDCDDDIEDPCAKTYTSDTVKALEHVYELRDSLKIAAVNMSLGAGQYSSTAACDAEDAARKEIVDRLRSVGIATVAASGNESQPDALTSPACVSSVISVGATTDSDDVASFSNSAPFLDLLAPGVQILSAVPGGSGGAAISGTSQAAPHVAAAFALLYQRLGESDVNQALSALAQTGRAVLDPRNNLSRPRIRVLDALNQLPGGTPTSSGLQITPDGSRILVSKDVGSERWAITLNADDGTVTGNVFKSDGSEPSFVWCEWLFDDGNPDGYEREVTFECSGAESCQGPACPAGQWVTLGRVALPGAFFLPPLATATISSTTTGSSLGGAVTPTGVQFSPDGKRTLISKDVGLDRWAIVLNQDDQTVTGNVYAPGDEPVFLWCRRVSDNGNPDPSEVQITYSCHVADRCSRDPCGEDQWRYLEDVIVPGWFFQADS